MVDDPDEFPFVDTRDGVSSNAEVAWKQNLVQICHKIDEANLPEKLKSNIKFNIDQILTSAGMTNISLGQIFEILKDWDNKMHVMKVMNPEIDTADFQDFKRSIRIELKLQLNKAKDGWQGNHAFEQRIKYDVRQTQETIGQKVGKFFGIGKSKKKVIEEEVM
jgi:hypothetical protein